MLGIGVGIATVWWLGMVAWLVGVVVAFWALGSDYYRKAPQRFFTWARNRGSARMLTGYVRYQILIIETNGERLSGQLRHRAESELEGALLYLSREAERYGSRVRFERVRARIQTIQLGDLEVDEHNRFTRESSERLSQAVLDSGAWAALEKHENGFMFVLTSDWHRPYAVQKSPWTRPEEPSREFAVSPAEAGPIAFAHEVLHLYGARDVYTFRGTNADARNRVVELATDGTGIDRDRSIMGNRLEEDQLHHLPVDCGNAYAVGWTHEPPLRSEPVASKLRPAEKRAE